jgi:hypothetical protein
MTEGFTFHKMEAVHRGSSYRREEMGPSGISSML